MLLEPRPSRPADVVFELRDKGRWSSDPQTPYLGAGVLGKSPKWVVGIFLDAIPEQLTRTD